MILKIKFLIKKLLQYSFPTLFYLNRTKHEGILLSFDDGPHPQYTPQIITTLASKNIKALFFVTGNELEKHPDIGRLIVDHGHMLGNHTYEHLDLKKCDFVNYKRSIQKTHEIISSFQPNGKKLFRPPYGRLSFRLITYIISSKSILMNWTVDSRDSFIKDSSRLACYVKGLPVTQGDILLFHEDYSHTITALSEIIDHLSSCNKIFCPEEFFASK